MIKLKSMLNITEQVPQSPGAPVPMQTPPLPSQSDPVNQPVAPEPETDTNASPEDPGEYDWTRDFRAFEDSKNRAESEAKKKLLDKMNKQLVGKKVTTNASRGYGQPKTDHTIDKVKKVSVEFWYKEWVVILQDENDKKYFLTPGVNIKIEQGGEEGTMGSDDQAPSEPEQAPTGTTGEEQPNPEQQPTAGGPEGGMPPELGGDMMGGAPAQSQMQPPSPMAPQTAVPQSPQPAVPQEPQPPLPAPKKKKIQEKVISAWTVGRDLHMFLMEFMSPHLKTVDFSSYVKHSKYVINESKTAEAYRVRLEIPVNHLKKSVDIRDIKLAAKEKLFSSGNIDQRFNRGSVDISKVGRVYVMNFVKQSGWKS